MNFEVINISRLKEFELGNEFIKEVIEAYIVEIPNYINQAESDYDNGRTEDLRRVLHTLKSHSKTLGMTGINDKLVYWEKEILIQPLEDFEEDFRLIKEKWSQAVEELTQLKSMNLF